jgi:hypothetical protein
VGLQKPNDNRSNGKSQASKPGRGWPLRAMRGGRRARAAADVGHDK